MDTKTYSYIRIESKDEDDVCEWLDGQEIPCYAISQEEIDTFLIEEHVKQNLSELLIKDSNKSIKNLSENMKDKIDDFIYYNENEAAIDMIDDVYFSTIPKIHDIIKEKVNNFCNNDDRYNDLLADYIKEAENE